jgi:alkylation response protein AidB-like acyl-CoA dehydrogenase
VLGMRVPESCGGIGFGHRELGIVLQEMGRYLYCGPFYGSCALTAGTLLHCASDEQKTRLLPGICDGSTIGSLAIWEDNNDCWDLELTKTSAEHVDDVQAGITGSKHLVLDAGICDLLLVTAIHDTQLKLYSVDPSSTAVRIRALETIDQTRKLFQVDFNDAAGVALCNTDISGKMQRVVDEATIGLANEMIGGAQSLLDAAVEYAKMRVQFGRQIGSFQAIKHKCADLLLEIELARSGVLKATDAIDNDDPEITRLASLAKAAASDAYMRAAAECIQIHGGVGFTWDNDTHLWFKRAKSSEVFLGSPFSHRERFIKLSVNSYE